MPLRPGWFFQYPGVNGCDRICRLFVIVHVGWAPAARGAVGVGFPQLELYVVT